MATTEGLYGTYASGEARDPDPPSDEETPEEDGAPVALTSYHTDAHLTDAEKRRQQESYSTEEADDGED